MWLHLEEKWIESIVKITGIKIYCHYNYFHIIIIYDGGNYNIKCNSENQCRAFFQELRENLSNPNKILQYGQIEDL